MGSIRGHILLVDDDEGFRYAAEKALRSAGFEIVAVPDYRGALETLESNQPLDLLLTDIVMPDRVNGFALARMARMRRLDLKVLYLSAYDVPSHEAIGKVLRKPITGDELAAEVRLALAS
jgi:CheY-like chemotaxis protein